MKPQSAEVAVWALSAIVASAAVTAVGMAAGLDGVRLLIVPPVAIVTAVFAAALKRIDDEGSADD